MPDGLVTNRPLQNQSTGLDLHVPVYQEVRGAMMTGHVEYQIIVVTRLAAFKSPRHRPGDTVQLMVPKTYSEMEAFHSRLVARHPGLDAMPAMPRKALFVGEADIRERRAAFDQLLRFIAGHPALAACPLLLEFLGAQSSRSTEEDIRSRNVLLGEEPEEEGRNVLLGEEPEEEEVNFFQSDEAVASRDDAAPLKRISSPRTRRTFGQTQRSEEYDHDDEDDEDDDAYLGPLGNTKQKRNKKCVQMPPGSAGSVQSKPRPADKVSLLFTDDDDAAETLSAKDGDVRLFEAPDLGGTVNLGDASLLLPTAYEKPGLSAGSLLDEDTDQLFRVEDDFAKLLQLTKRQKDKPALAPRRQDKPALAPKPGQKACSAVPEGGGSVAVETLKDQVDIFKYIQQQNQSAQNHHDLFQ